ncbi:cora-domain-containing protein [Coniochaeta ligniaria NRRL 30616]|uniref:Cora-domain-containing protein n=1 Tax=Coniochaeta ligniaria NRRL 30616 TaxID=1408157 RepID=A0A1J7J0N6_9PEZI|nr:cora-domain-containing protein [Coniochaeta ligniaria NRRL 30616]
MSDHEENTPGSGFSTPVPELDDHRYHTPSVSRPDRSRRGTFDSLYGARQMAATMPPVDFPSTTLVRDFEEEAVVDDEAADVSPTVHRTRRPTVESAYEQRSASPPNSVKAFAEARRQERQLSFSEPKVDKTQSADDDGLYRTVSNASHASFRSRHHTIDDASSLASHKSAEEDVCFPLQDERQGDNLYINFDHLETFMEEEREAKEERQRRASDTRVFADLRPVSSAAISPSEHMVTSDGDFVGVPCCSSVHEEKTGDSEEERLVKPAQQPHGGDPSRVSFFSSAWESTIHASDLVDLVLPGEDVRGLFSFPKGATDGVWWLNVNNPTEGEVRAICRTFNVHPLTIEDITTQESREKIELFPSYYFACFRSFYLDTDENTGEIEYTPFHVYVVVFREGTLSFSYATNWHASHVRKRITALKDYVALSSDWICYALIDDIVDSFAPVISKIEREADQIEDDVFIARTDDMHQFLRKIGNVRKNVMALMRLLGGKADVLKGFTKRCNENYKVTPRMDIGLYLGDIQDHVVTMMTNLGHFEKMLSRSHSNYLAQISIDGISQSTANNRVLSKITLLASIIVPLNVVTGLFGMNVAVPWGVTPGTLTPFFAILGGLVSFCIMAILLARRLRWI